jgi:hypothetical protein
VQEVARNGARGRNRTGMHVLYAADFKSAVSTDFTTRAREGVILPYIRGQTLSVLINSCGYNDISVICSYLVIKLLFYLYYVLSILWRMYEI